MHGVTRSIWILEHAQDVVTVTVGIVLIVLAAVVLVSGIVDFLDDSPGPSRWLRRSWWTVSCWC